MPLLYSFFNLARRCWPVLSGGLLLLATTARAQLSGTYQIGAGLTDDPAGARTFQSLGSALSSSSPIGLSTGVSGPVTFLLVDAAYPLTATLTVAAPASASSTNTVTVQPASGVTPLISGSLTGSLITLDGTDYLRFNGNDGSGGKAIIVRNSGNGSAVLLQNDATNNALRYLTLESAVTGVTTSGGTTTPAAGTVQFSATTGAGGNNDNLVEYCDVRAVNNSTSSVPTGAIYAVGTGTVTNNRVTVQNCNVYNFSYGGIFLEITGGGSAWTIQNNNVYQAATRSTQIRSIRVATGSGFVIQNNSVYQTAGTQATPFYGVAVSGGASGTVTGNFVGGSAAGATGNALSLTGTGVVNAFFMSVSTTTPSSVQGNTIRNISSASTGTCWGIELQGGAATFGTATTPNVIGDPGGALGISSTGPLYGLQVEGSATATIQGNTISALSSGSSAVAGVYLSGAGTSLVADNGISNLSSAATSGTVVGVYLFNATTQANASTIRNNRVVGVSASAGAVASGISLTTSATPTVSGNVVATLGSTSTGTSATVAGIALTLSGTTAATISNNRVSGVSAVGGSLVYGINLAGSAPATISGSLCRNLSSNLTTAAQLVGINTPGTGAVVVSNDTISNLSQTGLTGNLYGMQLNGISGSNATGNVVSGVTYSGGNTTFLTVYGISAGGSNAVSNNTVSGVSCAVSGAFNVRGIFVGGAAATTPTVAGNTVSGVSSGSTGGASVIGLLVGSATGGAVLGTTLVNTNGVSNVGTTNTGSNTAANTVTGLQLGLSSGSAATSVVERNRVWNVYGSATAGTADQVRGLAVLGTFTGTFANNQLSVAAGSTRQVGYGILDASTSSANTNYYYYNSVYLAPAGAAATGSSYGFYRNGASGSTPAVSLLNNVLYNGRAPASGTPAPAIGTVATGTFNSNYNLFIEPNAAAVGNYGNVIYPFVDWKAQSGGDRSSLSETSANVPAANLFVDPSAGNLNINPANPEAWYANGNGMQVSGQTADYNSAGTGRSTSAAAGGTDVGSNEFVPTSTPPALTASAAPAPGGIQTFTLGGRTLAQLTYGTAGTVPTAVTARYYSGTNPPAPFVAGARYANVYFDFSDGGTGSGYSYQPTLYYDLALLGTITNENAQQITLRNANNSGYRAFATLVNPTARTLALDNGASFNRLGTLAISDQAAPLPVTLAAFTAFRTGPAAELDWTSASELNSRGYEVQVSTDGLTYRALGFVASTQPNSATAQHYQFVDREAGKQGTRYYRLRQVDLDATSHYSLVRPVAFEGVAPTPALLAAPNPLVGGELTLTLTAARAGSATLTVLDAAGRPVLAETLKLADGLNALALPGLTGLPAGLYLVQVVTEQGTLRTRVVRQ